jgi:hypothetical protein
VIVVLFVVTVVTRHFQVTKPTKNHKAHDAF